MPKSSHSLSALPSQTTRPLEQLGLRLRAHRIHREWTVAEMAERLLCSPNTLRALESGKPGTSIGLLAHALCSWAKSIRWTASPPPLQDWRQNAGCASRQRKARRA